MSTLIQKVPDDSSKKLELLKLLLKKEGIAPARQRNVLVPPPLQAVSHDQPLPLSFAQQRLWFLDQLDMGSAVYNIPLALRISGRLSIDALEYSLQEIVQRHEVLRTTFHEHDGQPVQLVADVFGGGTGGRDKSGLDGGRDKSGPYVDLAVVDLAHLDTEAQQVEEQVWLHAEGQIGFDLAQGPLLRLRLLRYSELEHLFLVTFHHSIFDGWSFQVFFQELATLYQSFVTGVPARLPTLSIQYADYAVWQRTWLQGEILERQVVYWKQQLAGAPTALELPLDRPRPAIQTFEGASCDFRVTRQQSDGLKRLSREEGATLFMTLLASFQVLLSRYSGQEDIVVGTPIANRSQLEIEPLIGFFVNTLVMRTDLSGHPTFREIVRRVRKVALGAYSHQDVPFEQIVEAVQPARDLSRSPLFQVMFSLQNAEADTITLPDIHIQTLTVENTVAKFDLTLFMREHHNGLEGSLEYNCALFDAETMTRLVNSYQSLLDQMLASPDQPVKTFSLVTATERQLQLETWQGPFLGRATHDPSAQEMSIHSLFEEQVALTPEAIAISHAYDSLTYQDLNARANVLAHKLQDLGVTAGTLVGLFLEPSLELIIGILGVLKAGGAYVPLNTNTPTERLRFLLESAHASVVITQTSLQAALPVESQQRTLLCLDEEGVLDGDGEPVLHTATANDLAYMIYTSGSTGQPKGAGVFHRGEVNLLHWYRETFAIDAQERVLLLSSISFDLTQKNLFAPLLAGGMVQLISNDYYDPQRIAQQIYEQQITLINCTPSTFYPLVEHLRPEEWYQLASLRSVIFGGEPIAMQRLRGWVQSEECHAQVVNTYGPTECTDIALSQVVVPVEHKQGSTVPLGRPIANVQVVIVDAALQLLPRGVAGELCIAGMGVGMGYLNDAAMTASRFVPNPFYEIMGTRLYRTGDRARYLPDGSIEFLGRVDHQVKLRGFRIELGEIESVLQQQEVVQDCAVLVRESAAGDPHLVAYIVAKEAGRLEEVRRAVSVQVPPYMVPSVFVPIESLPLTINGKLDRQALAALPLVEGGPEQIEEPRTPREEKVAEVWRRVLDRERIDINENFFVAGGHSLLAVMLVNQLREAFQQTIPLATFFQNATIKSLAELLDQPEQTSEPEVAALVPIQPQGTRTPLFFVHPVGGEVFCYKELADLLGTDQPFYGLRFPFTLEDEQTPELCLEDLAAHYINAVRSIQKQGPYRLGGWSLGGTIAYAMTEKLREEGEEVAALLLLDSYAPATFIEERDDIHLLLNMVTDLASTAGYALPDSIDGKNLYQQLKLLSPQERLRSIWEQGQRWQVLPATLTLFQLQQVFNTFKANYTTMRRYQPGQINQRVHLFKPDEGREVIEDNTNGWGSLMEDQLEVSMLPGTHYTMLKHPCVELLAVKINKALAQL